MLLKWHRGKIWNKEFIAVAFLQYPKRICEYQKTCISVNLTRQTGEQYRDYVLA